MSKVVSGLFDNRADAEHAVADLENAGFSNSDISLVGHNGVEHHSNAAQGAGAGAIGGVIGGGAVGVLTGLGIMAIPGVGPVVAAGWLVTAAAGAAAGAGVGAIGGGLIGAMSKEGIPEEDAHLYAEGIRRGGTLVSVRTSDDRVLIADEILHRFQRADIVERRAAYTAGGWTRFDETAKPYDEAELAEHRSRWMR